MIKERFLFTGGSGSLGSAFLEVAESSAQIGLVTPSSRELDIADIQSCRSYFVGKNFDFIINSAAITNWERCHQDPMKAFMVNTLGALNMAGVANDLGIKFIHISTDAVFDGNTHFPYKEPDIPRNPVSIYGLSKLMAEIMIQKINPDSLIVRLSWLFGPNPQKDSKFVGAILKQIAQGKTTIKAVTDKHGSPSYTIDVVSKIFDLMSNGASSVRHVVNSGAASRYEVAMEIVKTWNTDTIVEPAISNDFPSIVNRPNNSSMESVFADTRLSTWQEALKRYKDRFPDVSSFG